MDKIANRLVDFMIIGAMKSGTTTLARLLKNHPGVEFCNDKEPDFFSKTTDWKKNIKKYNKLFLKTDQNLLLGEASTSYTAYPYYNPLTAKNIYEYNPDIKLIYLVRDPIDRAISHYMHFYSRGYTKLPLKKAIREIGEIVDRSKYHLQLRQYLKYFNLDQIKILSFEEFIKDKEIKLKEISDFLKLSFNSFPSDFKTIHSNPSVANKRRHHKLDLFYKFLYSHSIGKKIHNIIPPTIRTSSNRIVQSYFSGSFDSIPEVGKTCKSIIAHKTELDVYELERLIGRKLTEWENFYSHI